MRVTSNTFPNTLVNQLGGLATRQAKLQTQAATGQRVQTASDDPIAMRRVLDLQAESASVDQYGRNIDRQSEQATAVYSSLKSLQKITDRAAEIATLADGLKSPEELKNYATEVNQLIQQAVQGANAKNRGDFIFAGTKNDQAPFTMTQDANGLVTGVSYAGNESTSPSEIAPGQTLSVLPPGANTSGTGPRGLISDARSGADLFAHLIALRDHLNAGDTASIKTDQSNLGKDEDNIIYHYGLNGAQQSRLEAAKSQVTDQSLALQNSVSGEVDADMATTLVRLNETQNAYQAALQSGASILKLSLLNYI